MSSLSQALVIAYTVVPMTTGFCSVVGSSVIISMIFVSKKKFGDPYRRIIFGISFFDLLISLSNFLKVFKTTPEQPNAWMALGNQTSCNFLGFLQFAGLNGALLYNVSLNIYLLCYIKYHRSMTAGYFRTRIEPFLHGVPTLWAILSASIIVGTGHMNPAFAGECLIAPYPINCLMNPDVECIRGEYTDLYRTLFRVVPTFASTVAILVTLGMLWWIVRAQEKKMNRYRMNVVSMRTQTRTQNQASMGPASTSNPQQGTEDETSNQRFLNIMSGCYRQIKCKLFQKNVDHHAVNDDDEERGEVGDGNGNGGMMGEVRLRSIRSSTSSSFSNLRLRRSSLRGSTNSTTSTDSGRPFLIQARWYVIAFIFTHVCPIIVVSTEWGGRKPPPVVVMIAKVFTPLQGLFHIFIYTRPHVRKERRRDPTLSWWQAFIFVVKSGGDDDDERTNRFRGGTANSRSRTRSSLAASGGAGGSGSGVRNTNGNHRNLLGSSNNDRNNDHHRRSSNLSSTLRRSLAASSLGSNTSGRNTASQISFDETGGGNSSTNRRASEDEGMRTSTGFGAAGTGAEEVHSPTRSSKRVSILEVVIDDHGEEVEEISTHCDGLKHGDGDDDDDDNDNDGNECIVEKFKLEVDDGVSQ